ncbi:MAG: folate-binding protein YgfZ [Acidimicrobiales bacterium]|nr:folate-binding protein YgfZ [Acidimicrobiales bacterium]
MTTTFHRCARDVIEVSGPDARRWLQGQLSQDVESLPVSGESWTFVLSPQGKVDGWGRIRRTDEDSFAIDVDPGAGEVWTSRLDRFKLRTDAEVTLREQVTMVAVRGSRPDGFLDAGWPGVDGGDLLDTDDAPESILGTAVEVDTSGFEAMRIRSGVPRWGAELDSDTIPATVGQWIIDASVSFTKGCYTGQELVARIDSRGGNVPRRLALVTSPEPLQRGADVVVDGEVVGEITSVSADRSGSVGLAFVKRGVTPPVDGSVESCVVHVGALPST